MRETLGCIKNYKTRMIEINLEKSIKSKRLVYKSLISRVTEIIYFLALFGMFIHLFLYDTFLEIEFNNYLTFLLPICTLTIIYLLVYWYIKNDKLHLEKDILSDRNKIIIEEYLVQLTEQRNWKKIYDSENLKILKIPMSEIQIGLYSKLYLIYDNNDLLLNFSSFGFFDLKFPLNYTCNRNIEQKLIKKIRGKIQNIART